MSFALNREEKLLENISKLMARSSFNDLRIRLKNGVQLDANKVILAAMSPFFDRKLHERITTDQFLEIEIDIACSIEILEMVIKFFYTGKMNFDSLTLRELLDILYLLRLFEVNEFTAIEKFTRRQIEEGEFILAELLKLSSVAEAYNLDAIVSSIISCLKQNISEVSELPEVSYLSSNFLEDLINVNDEDDQDDGELHSTKFEILTLWLRSNTISEELTIKIKSMFDLRKFTNLQLISSVRNSKLFSCCSILDILCKSVLDLEKNLEEKTNKMSLITKKYSEEMKLKDAKLNKKDSELATLKEKISLLEKNHSTAINNFNSHLKRQKLTIESQDGKISGLGTELQAQKNELSSKTISFNRDLDWKNYVIDSKDRTIAIFEGQLETLKKELESKTNSFYSELSWKNHLINDRDIKIEDLEAEIKEKEEEIEDLKYESDGYDGYDGYDDDCW